MDDAPARGGFAETLLELEFIRRGLCSGFELTGSIQDMYVLFHILIFSVTMDESKAQKGILNFVEFMFPLFYRLTFLDLMCCGGAALLHRLPGCNFRTSEIVLFDFPVYDGFGRCWMCSRNGYLRMADTSTSFGGGSSEAVLGYYDP